MSTGSRILGAPLAISIAVLMGAACKDSGGQISRDPQQVAAAAKDSTENAAAELREQQRAAELAHLQELDRWRAGPVGEFVPTGEHLRRYLRNSQEIASAREELGDRRLALSLHLPVSNLCKVADAFADAPRKGLSISLFSVDQVEDEALVCLQRLAPDLLHTLRKPRSATNLQSFLKLAALVPSLKGIAYASSGAYPDSTLRAAELTALPKLHYIHLHDLRVDEDALTKLAPQLRRLVLRRVTIDAPSLQSLTVATELREFDAEELRLSEGELQLPEKGWPKLQRLRLQRGPWSLESLATFGRFAELRELSLLVATLPEVFGQELAKLKKLELLDLASEPLGPDARKAIPRMDHLRTLRLYQTKLDDAFVRSLSRLRTLEELNLEENRELTNASCEGLHHQKNLRILRLDGAAVDGRCLALLSQNRALQELSLAATRIKDGLESLAPLQKLQHLDLQETDVDDEALAKLPRLENLKSIDLSWTETSEEAFGKLQNERPELEINWREPGLE